MKAVQGFMGRRDVQAWGWCATSLAVLVTLITQVKGGNPFKGYAITMGTTAAAYLVLAGLGLILRKRGRK
jgi:peptidoglycan/LPS O-acetylase OafA/YrhL